MRYVFTTAKNPVLQAACWNMPEDGVQDVLRKRRVLPATTALLTGRNALAYQGRDPSFN